MLGCYVEVMFNVEVVFCCQSKAPSQSCSFAFFFGFVIYPNILFYFSKCFFIILVLNDFEIHDGYSVSFTALIFSAGIVSRKRQY